MSRSDDAMMHLAWAREAEKRGDFLAARMEYLKCVESWKQAGETGKKEDAEKEYEAFVKRDPLFKALLSILVPMIKANPGVLQSDIAKNAEATDWATLYNYKRQVAKDDIYYTLYFAEKFGKIKRTKKGRSYELSVI